MVPKSLFTFFCVYIDSMDQINTSVPWMENFAMVQEGLSAPILKIA